MRRNVGASSHEPALRVRRAARQPLERRHVRVPEHDQLERSDPRPRLARRPRAVRVRVSRRVVCGSRSSCPIASRVARSGCSQRNDANRERVPQHAAQRTVPPVLARAQAVAVLDVRSPARRGPRPADRTDSQRRRRRSTSPPQQSWLPATMSTGTPASTTSPSAATTRNAARGITVRHSNQNSNRSPLMTSDPAFARRARRKAMTRALDVGAGEAQVGVGEDVAGRLQHARILPMSRSLYKHARPDDLRQRDESSRGTPRRDPSADAAAARHPVSRPLRRNRPDGCRLSHELSDLVRGRSHRLHPCARNELRRHRAIGRRSCRVRPRRRGFTRAARYDDLIRVRTTLADVRSRSITFDYVITNARDAANDS